jgi:hypothetical protein
VSPMIVDVCAGRFTAQLRVSSCLRNRVEALQTLCACFEANRRKSASESVDVSKQFKKHVNEVRSQPMLFKIIMNPRRERSAKGGARRNAPSISELDQLPSSCGCD